MFSSPTILAAAVLSEPTDVEAAETPDGLGRPYMDVVFCSLPKLFNPPEGQGAGKLFAPRAPSNGGAIDARSPNLPPLLEQRAADMGTVGSVLDSPKDSPPPGRPSDYNIQKESRMQIFVKTLTGQSEGVPEHLMFAMSACVGGEPRQKNVVSLSLLSLSRCCLVVALPRVPSTVRYDEISVTHQLLFQ